MAEATDSLTIMAQAEAWLTADAKWLPCALPAPLTAMFEAERRKTRSRSAGLLGLFGALIAVIFYPLIVYIAPDTQPIASHVFLGVLVPAIVLSALWVLSDPPPLLREIALAIPSVCAVGVITYMFVQTRAQVTELFVGSTLLIILFNTVTIQLRFSVAVAVVVVDVILFGIGVSAMYGRTPAYQLGLVMMIAGCCIYMLIANWRMHADAQRYFVYTLRDRLRREALSQRNQELVELVRRDALTGLANRRAYDTWLQTAWQQAAADGTPLGLILADIDWFKAYNDFYGHPAGDACLQAVARCLREQLRGTTDQVARVGGEEFAIVLSGVALEPCGDIAERLRLAVAAMELPHVGVGAGSMVGVSFGVASLSPGGSATLQTLMESADCALYAAKQAGRDRVFLAGGGQPVRRTVAVPPLGVPD